MSEGVPDTDEVRAALDAILAWPGMARSPQLGQFLRYIVERTLAGEPGSIKAYAIAVDVLGRPADFDPQTDPIVRVQGRRLRALLDTYYAGPGVADPVRISLPVGRYVPDFLRTGSVPSQDQPVPGSPRPDPPRSRGWLATLAVLVVVAAAGVVAIVSFQSLAIRLPLSGGDRIERPRVTVVEFQSEVDADVHGSLSAGLALELVTDLAQFGTMDVRYGEVGSVEATGAGSVDFQIGGEVAELGGRWQYQAQVTEPGSGRVIWSKTVEMLPGAINRTTLVDDVSGRFSRVLGSPRGPIHARARALLEEGVPLAGRESPYLCRMLFDLFRERETISEAQRTAACLAQLSPSEQSDGETLAIRAGLALASVPPPNSAPRAQGNLIVQAEALLEQAVLQEPTSAFVWEQRARLAEIAGDHRLANEAYRASLQLNPASLDALAAHARHLALLGDMNQAVRLAGVAIEGAPEAPPSYLAVPTLAALAEGRFTDAAGLATRYAEADRELGPVLAIAAARGIDDGELADRYLNRIVESPSYDPASFVQRLRMRVADAALLGRLLEALGWAGLPLAPAAVGT